MEVTKVEVNAIEQVVEAVEKEASTLTDLQLALVGGGMGEHVWG